MGAASPASAWTGNLGSCYGYPSNFISTIHSDSRYNENTSWVAFQRNWGGAPYYGSPALAVVWGDPNSPTIASTSFQIVFTGNSLDNTDNVLSTPRPASLYRIIDGEFVETSGGGGSWSSMGFADVNCVQDVHNVIYAQSYVGASYADLASSMQLYTGIVHCVNGDPEAMIINQAGNDGSASIVQTDPGEATWGVLSKSRHV